MLGDGNKYEYVSKPALWKFEELCNDNIDNFALQCEARSAEVAYARSERQNVLTS